MKEVVFKLTIDEGTFNQDIVKATRQIEALKHEKVLYDEKRKLGIKLTDEEVIAEKKLQSTLKAHEAQLRNLQKITQLQTEANIAQNGSVDQLTKQYKAAELELKRLGGTVERGADGTLTLTNAYKENEAATFEIFQTLKEYDAQLGKHNLNVGNYGGVLSKLKQQITELDVQRNIATDPEEVKRLTAEMRKLTLQYDQYTGKVDELGNRVAKNDIKDNFQDLQSGSIALTGGLTLLSLAVGDNSKGMQALRVIMVSVTAAQTALTIAQSKADIKASLLIIRTKALAAAQWAYNNAVAAFSVIGAIGLLAALVKITNAQKNQNEETQIALDQQKKWAENRDAEIQRELKNQEDLFEGFSQANKRRAEINLAESKGIDQTKERIDLLQEEINSYQTAINANENAEKARKELGAFNKTMNKDEVAALKELIFNRQIELNQLATRKKEVTSDDLKKETDAIREKASAVNLLTTAERARLDQQIKTSFFESPDVQDAFQKLLGIDDATFAEVWAKAQEPIDYAAQGIVGVDKATQNLNATTDETNEKLAKWQETISQNEQAIYQLGAVMSNVFQGAFSDADDAQKQFFKNAIIGLLDYLQKFVMEKKIEALVSQLASKGFVGVLTGAAIVGLIDGAFAAAKSQITGYAEGGLVTDNHGIPIQRSNGDNRLATLKTGEVVMNETQQENLKKVAGVDIFSKLRIPGFIDGGLNDGGFGYRQATKQVNENYEISQMVANSLLRMPSPVVYVSDLERVQMSKNRAVNITTISRS